MTEATDIATDVFITPGEFLAHWQGHRALTRRVIEAFPENQLFTFSIGGMRTFGALAMEIVTMGAPMIRGIVTGQWENDLSRAERPKSEILRLWDEATDEIDRLWPQIPPGGFQETAKAFGQWEGSVSSLILYAIDNEIHHRGQGYVYLRSLGIQPPFFFER